MNQELTILKQLVQDLKAQWDSTPILKRAQYAHTLMEVQSDIKDIVDGYKDELRASEQSRVAVSESVHFHIGDPKTRWVLKDDADLMGMQKELGAMFNVLFYASLRTTPKFEETLMELPERQKTVLFQNVEQRQVKGTVRVVKRKTQSQSDQ